MSTRLCLLIGLLSLIVGCGTSLFSSPSTAQSPHGSTGNGIARSPDGLKLAQEIGSFSGHVGIYSTADNSLLVDIKGWPTPNNDLKGLAWSPDSRLLAIMYHDAGSYIAIYDATTGKRQANVDTAGVPGFIHYMSFGDDQSSLIVSNDGSHRWTLATGL